MRRPGISMVCSRAALRGFAVCLSISLSLFSTVRAWATACGGAAIATPQQNFTASATGAAATVTATLPAPPAGYKWQITGFEITANGSTAGASVTPTLSGLDGGAGAAVTGNYSFVFPASASTAATPLTIVYSCPISGLVNTAISLSLPSGGAGNTTASVNIHAFPSQ